MQELIIFALYWRAFLVIFFFFHFVLLLDCNARVLFLAFYFNYIRLSEFITDVLTMFIEVICFFLCNSVNDSDKTRYYYRAHTDSKIKSMYILESVSKYYFDALLHANFIE